MSYDLSIWYSDKNITLEEAENIHVTLCEQGISDKVCTNHNIELILQEIIVKYPLLSDYLEQDDNECPWNCDFDISESHITIAMKWSKVEELTPWLAALTEKYSLYCYNPQEHYLYSPLRKEYISYKP